MPRLLPVVLSCVLAWTLTLLALALPPQPWYGAEWQRLTLLVTTVWWAWRHGCLGQVLLARRQWQHNTPLTLTTRQFAALHQHAHGWCLGLAFPWQGRHTQVLEQVLARDTVLPVAQDELGGHPALHHVGRQAEQPLRIPVHELGAHTLITGTPGSGKTVLLRVITEEALRNPGAVIFVDPKGDLLDDMVQAAERHGRLCFVINLASPHDSACLNVLGTATTPAEVSARIRALMPSAGGRPNDPFFEQFPLAFIERLAAAQQVLGIPWTLEELYRVSIFFSALEQLLEDYLHCLGFSGGRGLKQLVSHYEKTGPPNMTADALIELWRHDRDHFQKVTGNLLPAFRGLVDSELSPLFSSLTPDFTWEEVLEAQALVYVSLPALLYGDTANRAGRIILQDLIGYLGRCYAYQAPSEIRPVTIIVDELREVLYPLFVTALAMARGAGARFVLAQQSIADAEFALGRAGARVMADNLDTKIWCRVSDDDTAAAATEGLGLCTVEVPETGVGLAKTPHGLSQQAQRRFVAKDVPLIRPTWLKALPRGQAFVRTKGEVWKLKIPLLVSEQEETPLCPPAGALPAPSLALPASSAAP